MERLDALELKAAGFDDMNRVFRRLIDLRAERMTDVAADQHAMTASFEHAPRQRGGGRLPFRPGDRNHASPQPARRQLEHRSHIGRPRLVPAEQRPLRRSFERQRALHFEQGTERLRPGAPVGDPCLEQPDRLLAAVVVDQEAGAPELDLPLPARR